MRISTTRTIPTSLAQVLAVAVLTSSCSITAWARQDEPTLAPPIETVTAEPEVISTTDDALSTSQPPIDGDFEEVEGATPLMQGPVHEAFAERFNAEDEDPMVVSKEPPQMIDEQPPEYRPDGENIEWIPGYWGWDIAIDDFVWVSGVWRQIPPGQQWIPGYWTQTDQGWRWISGFWMAEANEQIVYLPPPPQSIDNGPSSPAPGPDHFWVSGYWGYNANSNYGWQAGYWHPCQQNWVWIPARYIWTPSGYVYRAGYWDFEVNDRGMLFAPVAFQSGFNRVYRPSYVIETSPLLFANLYVAPGASYYYFGSTYAHTTRRPCYPWVSYYRHGYDPMFSYYAYQQSHRTWLRGVSSLQLQIAAMPHSGNGHRFTVADQLRLHHGLNPGHGLNGQPGIPGQPRVNSGVHLHGTNNGPNSMFHVASLTSLAAKNNQKVDFKTPFSVKPATQGSPKSIANAAQFNEFSKKRRDLEVPTNPLDKANALVQSNTTNLRDPKSQPAVNPTLKQIELVKPQDKSRLPRDLKIGSGVSASTFAKSNGIPTNSAPGVNGSTNAKGSSGIGSNITGTNIGGTSGTGTNVLGGIGTKPNSDPNKNANSKRQHESQQFSQLFGGSDKTPLDTKQLESLRSSGPSKKNVGSLPGNTKGTSNPTGSNPTVKGSPTTGQGLGGGIGGGQGIGGNRNPGRGNVPGNNNIPGNNNNPGNNKFPGNTPGNNKAPGNGNAPGNNGSGGNVLGGNVLGGAGQGGNTGPGVLGGNILGGNKPNSGGSGLPSGVLGGSKPPAGTGVPQGGTVFKPPMNPPPTGSGNGGVQGGGLGNGGVFGGGRPNAGNPNNGAPKNGAPNNGTPGNGARNNGGFRPGSNGGGNSGAGSTKGGNRPGSTGLGSGLGNGGPGSGGLGSGGIGGGRSGNGLGGGLSGGGSTPGGNLSGGNKGSGTIGGGNTGGNRLGGNPGTNSGGGRLGGNRGGNGDDKNGGRK